MVVVAKVGYRKPSRSPRGARDEFVRLACPEQLVSTGSVVLPKRTFLEAFPGSGIAIAVEEPFDDDMPDLRPYMTQNHFSPEAALALIYFASFEKAVIEKPLIMDAIMASDFFLASPDVTKRLMALLPSNPLDLLAWIKESGSIERIRWSAEGHHGLCHVLGKLFELSMDSDATVRKDSASALGCLGVLCQEQQHAATHRLFEMFQDPDAAVRESAAVALASLCDRLGEEREALKLKLLRLYKDSDGNVRRTSAVALDRLGGHSMSCRLR